MSEAEIKEQIASILKEHSVKASDLDAFASQLIWRIGRLTEDGPVTVRIGLASSVASFADLPRLKTATDAELEQAAREGNLRVEWVGAMPQGSGKSTGKGAA